MGEECEIDGKPQLVIHVRGTDEVQDVTVVRDGEVLRSTRPGKQSVEWRFADETFDGQGYYYVRATQADSDEHGNPSCAWSSPIWVRKNTHTR